MMAPSMNPVLIGVLAYIGLQLVLGFWVSRRIATEDDYLVAGRSLGFALSTFTVFATWFGAETCIGAAGAAYSDGLPGTTADPFGYALCLLFMGAVFAVPLWRRKLTTLADLFRMRFGTGVERLAVLIMVPSSVMWAAAQIRAFGQVLGATSSLEVELTITIAAAVVIVYTVAGGLLADAITDLIQGVVLIIGLVLVATLMLASGDIGALADVSAAHLSLRAPDETVLGTMEKWAIPIFGSVMAQELVARVVAARSPGVARSAGITASVIYFSVAVIPVVVGLVAARVAPGLDEPEQVLIHQAARYLPTLLYIVFAGALVSAILSTVDSALLVAGSLVAHNLILPMRPGLDERGKIRVNRIAVMCFGVLAYVLALRAGSVYHLVEEASAFGSAGIFVSVTFGLFTRIGGAASAIAALVLGIAVYAGGSHFIALPHPYLAALASAMIGYVAFAGSTGLRPSR